MEIIQGGTFTFKQICAVLHSNPDAHLDLKISVIDIRGEVFTALLQHDHVTRLQLLRVPGFAASTWLCVKKSTHHNMYTFLYKHVSVPLLYIVDTIPAISEFDQNASDLWITPKGYPAKQPYFFK